MTYQEYLNVVIDSYDSVAQNDVKAVINKYIRSHYKQTDDTIQETQPHPISGTSWQWLTRVAIRGDFKGRQSNYLNTEATKAREKLGITLEQALKQYGKR